MHEFYDEYSLSLWLVVTFIEKKAHDIEKSERFISVGTNTYRNLRDKSDENQWSAIKFSVAKDIGRMF